MVNCPTVNCTPGVVAPLGFCTEMLITPGVPMLLEGTCTVMVLELMLSGVSDVLPKFTEAPPTKFNPVMVSSNPGLPARIKLLLSDEMLKVATEKGNCDEALTSARLFGVFCTVTWAVPTCVTSVDGIEAVSWVELENVVASGFSLGVHQSQKKKTCEVETKLAPLMVRTVGFTEFTD